MNGLEQQTVVELLRWYQSIGVDETIAEQPFDKTVSAHEMIRRMVEAQAPQEQDVSTKNASAKTASKTSEASSKAPLGKATAVQDAQKLVAQCQTIEELKTALQGFEGCSLKGTASSFVFADGNPQSSIMFIGDAPDVDEDRDGIPFIGRNGDFFRLMISHIGLEEKEKYYMTSVVPWRPPGGREPTEAEIAMLKPFVLKHIELVRPKILVLVGATAAKAFLTEPKNAKKGILKLRQGWHEMSLPNGEIIPVKAMFSASFLLEQPAQKRAAWNDLLEIKQKLFS